ncbi:hypothetical protein [Sporocytophaga myxococcoides]|uniref:hypothetical protein n=1 Tax=Sporocytophaga myxococcoides TaxID=153721 RepID=UPI0009DC29A0|nr:hypothetical protein [Sporocytophaga myxococcoides]
MKRKKQLIDAFGLTDCWEQIDFPPKTSNIQISRIIYGKKECSFCFPHGWETSNSTIKNRQRNWKKFRHCQWKEK